MTYLNIFFAKEANAMISSRDAQGGGKGGNGSGGDDENEKEGT